MALRAYSAGSIPSRATPTIIAEPGFGTAWRCGQGSTVAIAVMPNHFHLVDLNRSAPSPTEETSDFSRWTGRVVSCEAGPVE